MLYRESRPAPSSAATRAECWLAERAFLAASVAVWREIDKHIDSEGHYVAGVPSTLTKDANLRKIERCETHASVGCKLPGLGWREGQPIGRIVIRQGRSTSGKD